LLNIFDHNSGVDKNVVMVTGEDIRDAYVSQGGCTTPITLAILRTLDRSCHINRMGYVCDQWNCFAIVNPKLYTLTKKWEDGGVIIRPFIFDLFVLPKEFNAYPGGKVIDVKKLEKTRRVFIPTHLRERLSAITPVVPVLCQG
jgi:hypothetical protein